MIIEAPVVVLIAMSNLIGRQFLIPTRRNKEFTLSVTYGAISNIILNVPAIMLWGVRGADGRNCCRRICGNILSNYGV